MAKMLYRQTCPYCGARTLQSNTKGGSMFNRDKHIESCEQAPAREQQKAGGRTH